MYSNIDNPKLTPEPPVMMINVELVFQFVREMEPSGPSTKARIKTPRVGGWDPFGNVSPGGPVCLRTIRPITLSHRSLVHPDLARIRNTSARPESLGEVSSHIEATVNG